jgi:hypothetical protein
MSPDVDDPAAEASAAGRTGTGVYVYGVTRAPADTVTTTLRGVGDPPATVRAVEGGDLAALVSDVRAGWTAARREDVEAHDHLLSRTIESATVVPMRFGVVMPSEDHVREDLLERHGEEIRTLVARVDGKVQMTLKAFYLGEALLRAALERNPQLKRRSDALRDRPADAMHQERIALGRDVAAAVEAQRSADEQLLLDPLMPVVDDAVAQALASERMALNAQLLVARDRRDELDGLVRELSERHGDRFSFRYVGPLAPFSFTSLTLDMPEDRWG